MKPLSSPLALLVLAAPLAAQTWRLDAVDSVSITRVQPSVFTDNRIRAYNNPNSSVVDVVGVYKFDVSTIPDTTKITAMKLTLYMENAFSSPRNGPIVDLHHSADDSWTRATATPTSAALGKLVCANQANFVHPQHVFTIDLTAYDFSADLVDDAITLVIDNVNPTYSYVYFYGHTGSPLGTNAQLEITASPCAGYITPFGEGGKDCSVTTHRLGCWSCPTLGQVVRLQATVGTSIQLPILLFLGISDQTWGAVPLPFDLTPLGAPGNHLYVSLDIGPGLIPNGGGGGPGFLPIPNDTRLRGVSLYLQTILWNCSANNLRLVFSNGLKLVIG